MRQIEESLRAQSQRRDLARIGGHASIAAQGPNLPARRMREGKRAKYERETIAAAAAEGRTMTPREIAAIVEHKLWLQLANARAAKAAKKAANDAIRAIANPPAACVECYAERPERFPDGYTSKTCKRHERKHWRELAASRVYGAPNPAA